MYRLVNMTGGSDYIYLQLWESANWSNASSSMRLYVGTAVLGAEHQSQHANTDNSNMLMFSKYNVYYVTILV